MYKYRTRTKKSRLKRLALSAPLVLIGLTGSSFGFLNVSHSISAGASKNARVFTQGLKIELDRTSPTFAALEDAWLPDFDEAKEFQKEISKSVRSESLTAGGTEFSKEIARIQQDNQREQHLIAQEKAMREAQARALAQAAAAALRRMAATYAAFDSASKDEASPKDLMREKAQQMRRQIANGFVGENNQAPIQHPTRTISLSDLKVSREELVGSLFFPMAASDAAPSRNQIVVARNSAPQARDEYDRDLGAAARKARKPIEDDDLSQHALTAEPLHQVVVSGPVEFSEGLALSNTLDQLSVFREFEGEAQEYGRVSVRDGRYEIFLEETSGQLIAELRSPYGDLLGKGEIELNRLRPARPNDTRIESVKMKIRPVSQGMTGTVLGMSKLSKGNDPLNGVDVSFRETAFQARTKPNGSYNQPNFLDGSIAIARVSRPGYWGTTAFVQSGNEQDLNLLPNQPGQTMHDLISSLKTDILTSTKSAIIWGRVTVKGKPVAGARVDLMTTETPVRPIYFNAAMVPDPKLTETSTNGLYAFFPVPAGAHAVQAMIDNVESEPVIFPAEEQMSAKIDLETSPEREAKLKVFDAFRTDWPLSANVTDPGFTRTLKVPRSGETVVKHSGGDSLLILDLDGGHLYERIRLALARDRKIIYAPMIQSSWLEKIRSSIRSNKDPGTGVVIGFIQGQDPYQVSIERTNMNVTTKVLYFNNRGDIVSREYGEPGGGFILLNVPEGFRTILVQPSGVQKVFSTVVLVDNEATSVFSQKMK